MDQPDLRLMACLAMGIDPPTDDVMQPKPRHPDDRELDAGMRLGVFEIGAVIAVVTLLTMDMYLPGGLIGQYSPLV